MPTLANPRHESFAQELAKGHSKAEALSRAGYGGSRSCASRLSTKADIRSRIAELQANAAVSTVVTIEGLTLELEQARELAMARGNASAAVLAVIAKARLHVVALVVIELSRCKIVSLKVLRNVRKVRERLRGSSPLPWLSGAEKSTSKVVIS